MHCSSNEQNIRNEYRIAEAQQTGRLADGRYDEDGIAFVGYGPIEAPRNQSYGSVNGNFTVGHVKRVNRWEFLGIASGLCIYFVTGVSETIMCSYFPVEARKRGLNSIQTGVAISTMEATNFLFSFVVMYFISDRNQRFFWVAGILLSAVGTGTLGLLNWVHSPAMFLTIAIAGQAMDGTGGALSLATTIPLMTSTAASSGNTGSIISWAEALLSCGCLIGPPLGSVLYNQFGFFMPSFVSATLFLACFLMSVVFLIKTGTQSKPRNHKRKARNPEHTARTSPKVSENVTGSPDLEENRNINSRLKEQKRLVRRASESSAPRNNSVPDPETRLSPRLRPRRSEPLINASVASMPSVAILRQSSHVSRSVAENKFDHLAYVKFIISPNLLLLTMLAIIIAAQMAFFDVCVSLYLTDTFGINAVQIGLIFLAFACGNLTMTPIYGYCVDKGFTIYIVLFTALGHSISLSLLYLPDVFPHQLQTIPYTVFCFVLTGMSSAGAFVPGYLLYQKIAELNYFDNNTQFNKNQTRLLATTWCNNLYAIGFFFGSVLLSGPVFDNVGFAKTNLVISLTMLLFVILSLVYILKKGLLIKMFYDEESSNAPSETEDFSCSDEYDSPDSLEELDSNSQNEAEDNSKRSSNDSGFINQSEIDRENILLKSSDAVVV